MCLGVILRLYGLIITTSHEQIMNKVIGKFEQLLQIDFLFSFTYFLEFKY